MPTTAKSDPVTVKGPISAEQLGITLPHEHLLIDASSWFTPPKERYKKKFVDVPMIIKNLGVIRRDPYISKMNLVIDDEGLAVREALEFKWAGGSTLVDMTNIGVGPNPLGLLRISEKTGLNIIAGCGYYRKDTHPSKLAKTPISRLSQELIHEIERGLQGTSVKPGVIGEVGTSNPIHMDEVKVLRAAARAHLQTGAPINVHLTQAYGETGSAGRVLDILENENVNLCRVVLSHMDDKLDEKYHEEVAERGAYVEYDNFGCEWYVDTIHHVCPRDTDRIAMLKVLIDKGFEDRLLISQDVFLKISLKRYGGWGYDHILRNVVPIMNKAGIEDKHIEQMMIRNPAELLPFKLR